MDWYSGSVHEERGRTDRFGAGKSSNAASGMDTVLFYHYPPGITKSLNKYDSFPSGNAG